MRFLFTIAFISCGCFINGLLAQQQDSVIALEEDIAVLARISEDSITLRWAPRNFETWQSGIDKGFHIERFTMLRGRHVVSPPEKATLTQQALRPESLDAWENLVKTDRYAAVAAQAIFGDDFSVDIQQTDVISIANKVAENDQRFAFAIFAADMSPATARKSGLWFSDRSAKADEKYLYRIIIGGDSLGRMGSAFIGMRDSVFYPQPLGVSVESSEKQVSIRWRQHEMPVYSWYKIERSTDSINFIAVGDIPILTLSPTPDGNTKFNYAYDSIPDINTKYFYRILGVTPFGDESPPSEIASLLSVKRNSEVPYINDAASIDNKSISISWEFTQSEKDIKGFLIERSQNDAGPYSNITLQHPLPSTARSFTDINPLIANYYKVSAIGLDNGRTTSPSYFATLVDSIPPASPIGLHATIDNDGLLKLSWKKNGEADLLGYRIYKSNHVAEEPFQVTDNSIVDNTFSERINLNTLNREVYYSVIAIDRNQNNSSLSSVLRVALPDKIKPSAPVMLPVRTDSSCVKVSWVKSSSHDVVQYDVYRSLERSNQWQRLKIIGVNSDSVFLYKDCSGTPSIKYNYTIVAIDSVGNESEKATPVEGTLVKTWLSQPVAWIKPLIDSESKSARLRWAYEFPNVKAFKIFKSVGDQQYQLFKTLPPSARELIEPLSVEFAQRYKIIAVFNDGIKSGLSEEIVLTF